MLQSKNPAKRKRQSGFRFPLSAVAGWRKGFSLPFLCLGEPGVGVMGSRVIRCVSRTSLSPVSPRGCICGNLRLTRFPCCMFCAILLYPLDFVCVLGATGYVWHGKADRGPFLEGGVQHRHLQGEQAEGQSVSLSVQRQPNKEGMSHVPARTSWY